MSQTPSQPQTASNLPPVPMNLLYLGAEIYLHGIQFELGSTRRNLAELKNEGLICNEPDALAAQGYKENLSIAPNENLQSLAAAPFGRLLEGSRRVCGLVFHHSYPDSSWLAGPEGEAGFMSRTHYFPPALMQQFKLDHVPYFVSFGSGCTGLLSMLMMAAGLWNKTSADPVICLTADVRPPGTTFDAFREKILTSDCSSSFLVSREKRGYRVLGISYYSTPRQIVPLVEIVKRTVKMIRELAKELAVDISPGNVVVHYPNIFPSAWDMVSQYLEVPKELHVLDGMAERAHCLSSDSMISLAKRHGGGAGRAHVVVNFGSGLHLGACILREEEAW